MEHIIGHIDMDAFFASVEERDRPYLKGTPVIVGSDPQGGNGRGVVATANYEARKLGIHSALPISKAWQLCKGHHCTFITAGAGKYGAASQEVFNVVRQYVTYIEQVSIDEAYLDLSGCASYEEAQACAQQLKQEIHTRTGLTASVGIGPNKMVAKIASDHQKPDGLTVVTPESVEAFLSPLPVGSVPGIGKVSVARLARQGIKTVRDLQNYSWEELQEWFGSSGFSFWERVRGIDSRKVETSKAKRKSIGKHHTFMNDTHDLDEVMLVIKEQAQSIIRSLHKKKFESFKTVVVTVRLSDFSTKTRSVTTDAMHTTRDIELKALKLLIPFFEKKENPKELAIRLVGVRVEKVS